MTTLENTIVTSTPEATPSPPGLLRRRLLVFGLLAPALLVSVAVAATFVLMAFVSVQDSFGGPVGFTLSHYREFFMDSYLLGAALETLLMGLVTTLICAVLGYPMAWYLVMSSSRHAYIVFIIVLTPLLVSIVVRTIGWTIILGNEGLVNAVLLWTGLIEQPLSLMQSFWSVVAALVHVLIPFMVLSITAVLGKIDRSMIEAAMTLGCPPARAFRLVTLPLSIQGVATGSVIVFCLTVGSYLTPLWLGRGSVPVLALTVRQQVLDLGDWPGGAVQALVLAMGAFTLIGLMTLTIGRSARR